ncbi:MAG: glycine/sarcosine/betaine reductase complex component C subunit beta [Candidatus Dormibacteria bacterium]
MTRPVVSGASQVLAHLPGVARHGSKPARELPRNPELDAQFAASLRSFDEAIAYAPHRAYLGTIHPRDMPARPWAHPVGEAPTRTNGDGRYAPDGELVPEEEALALVALADDFDLITLDEDLAHRTAAALARHPLAARFPLAKLEKASGDAEAAAAETGALPLQLASGALAGGIRRGHDEDQALTATVLLENLACKATATLALLHLLEMRDVDPGSIEFVISCSEEAIGDRYQRGGGNMAKAVAIAAGLDQASGADIKNFCAAPLPAMVVAGALVASGVFTRVAVVAGGSLPKLGMKFQGHLKHGLPVLEDVVGGAAFLVEADDGASPAMRLDSVGRHRVAAGSSNPQIMEALAVEPLARLGLSMRDVDDYATELHDPDITEPQGSGNVPERNYKLLAALAARRGDIDRGDIEAFMSERGMPGFAPTQGHLASALCYLPHALRRLTTGDAMRVQMIAKGSLFLGRMTQQSDGMSVLLERNAGAA